MKNDFPIKKLYHRYCSFKAGKIKILGVFYQISSCRSNVIVILRKSNNITNQIESKIQIQMNLEELKAIFKS